MIEICVEKNQARLKKIEQINSGSIGIVGVKFIFSGDWKDFKKTAIVYVDKYDEERAFKYILKDDTIPQEDMPKELFKDKADLYIGVFGDNADEQRIVTNAVFVPIREGIPTEGVNLEAAPDLYNQIMGALIELEKTGDNLKNRADNGEFNGKDGVDGKDGKDGADYVLTESDKSAIAEIAGNMLDYVPPTRTIAGQTLEQDIATDVLAAMLYPEVLSQGKTVIKGYAKEDIDTLLSATSKNAIANSTVYALQQALQADINANYNDILALQTKDKWELILDKTLPAQSSDGTLIDFGDLTLGGDYKELRIVTALWNSADTGDIQLFVNNMSEPIITLKNVIQYGATYSFDFALSTNDLFKDRYIVMSLKKSMTGVNATSSAESSYVNSSTDSTVPDIQSITNLKLHMTAGWNNSTERYVRVYGRK